VSGTNLADLQYKEFDGDRLKKNNGFFSKAGATHLYLALYEHFALKGQDPSDLLTVDSEYYKATFEVSEPMEALDEEDEPINQTCMVSATVKMVESEPGSPNIPNIVYMNFKKKEGNPVAFGSFLKSIMSDMDKFMMTPPAETEGETAEIE